MCKKNIVLDSFDAIIYIKIYLMKSNIAEKIKLTQLFVLERR